MKGNLYRSMFTNKTYLVEHTDHTKGKVKLVCMHFPYTRVTASISNIHTHYKLITKEKQ